MNVSPSSYADRYLTQMANEQKKKNSYRVNINYSWCKKCGICITFCPTGVFTTDEFGAPVISSPEKCINCQLCVFRCPDFAIEVKVIEENVQIANK